MKTGQAKLVLLEAGGTHLLVVENAKDDPVTSVVSDEGSTWFNIGKPDSLRYGSAWTCNQKLPQGTAITVLFGTGWHYTLVVQGDTQWGDAYGY
jgi:hypothetical protein